MPIFVVTTSDVRLLEKQVLEKALSGKEAVNSEFSLVSKVGDRIPVLRNTTSVPCGCA
jgi:hypothetical protein